MVQKAFSANSMLFLLLSTLAFASNKQLECKPGKYGLVYMENRRIQNTFCLEHSGRTCCDDSDIQTIRTQYEVLRQQSEISTECLSVM